MLLSRTAALRPLARATTRSPVVAIAPSPSRSVTTLSKTLYTAKAQSGGQGRNGKAHLTEGGPFEVKLAMPKELGGSGDGQNPEQLFAMGYSACFLSALGLSAKENKIALPANVKCEAHVSIGPPEGGATPFAIAVELVLTSDAKNAEEKSQLKKAVDIAHGICPYSLATKGNVPVTLTVQ